jgi:hypothetical protein
MLARHSVTGGAECRPAAAGVSHLLQDASPSLDLRQRRAAIRRLSRFFRPHEIT